MAFMVVLLAVVVVIMLVCMTNLINANEEMKHEASKIHSVLTEAHEREIKEAVNTTRESLIQAHQRELNADSRARQREAFKREELSHTHKQDMTEVIKKSCSQLSQTQQLKISEVMKRTQVDFSQSLQRETNEIIKHVNEELSRVHQREMSEALRRTHEDLLLKHQEQLAVVTKEHSKKLNQQALKLYASDQQTLQLQHKMKVMETSSKLVVRSRSLHPRHMPEQSFWKPQLESFMVSPIGMAPLLSSLLIDHFYNTKVRIPQETLEDAMVIIKAILCDLFCAMVNLPKNDGCPKLGQQMFLSGSVNEKLKVFPPNEFEFIFPLEPPNGLHFYTHLCHEDKDFKADALGFGIVKVISDDGHSIPETTKNFTDIIHGVNMINFQKFKKWFQRLVDEAKVQIEKKWSESYKLTCLHNNASACLTIKNRYDQLISVDIVPAIKVMNCATHILYHVVPAASLTMLFKETPQVYLVAKECKYKAHKITGNHIWRLSFSLYEAAFLQHVDSSLPCGSKYRECLTTVKSIVNLDSTIRANSPLTSKFHSYFMKTTLLHMLLEDLQVLAKGGAANHWVEEDLESLIHRFLRRLLKDLEKKELKHFFIGNVYLDNLFPVLKRYNQCPGGLFNLYSEKLIQGNMLQKIKARLDEINKNLLQVIMQNMPQLEVGHVAAI